MNTLISFESLLISGSAVWLLTEWLDTLVKSALLLCIPMVLGFSTKYRKASSLLHSVWFQTLIAVSLLPVAALVSAQLSDGYPYNPAIIEIGVKLNAESAMKTSAASLVPDFEPLLLLYFTPLLLLITLSIRSFLEVIKLSRSAKPCEDKSILQTASHIRESLGLSTPITIKLGEPSISPFTFGFRKPEIILPESAIHWSSAMTRNVLIHEISHIARHDWLTMIIAQIIICLNWFNPVCWFINSRLMEEAEHSCDSEVLKTGVSDTEYAENLVSIAKQCRHGPDLLAQMLVGKSKLRKRINLVLEGNMKTVNIRTVRNVLGVIVALVTVSIGSIQVLAANPSDQEYGPTFEQIPVYPKSAADEGITGWVWFEFTVLASGAVDAGSIVLLDESPSGTFTNSAHSALVAYEFSPRIENGIPVDVPGVQYVFRYELED